MAALQVTQVTEDGRVLRSEVFDLDQLPEAEAELDAMYTATLSPSDRARWQDLRTYTDAVNADDLDALAVALAPGAKYHDHRPTSFGELDRASWLESYVHLFDEVPDVYMVWTDVFAMVPGTAYVQVETRGHRAGGAISIPLLVVAQQEGSVVTALHLFPVKERSAADACFAELASQKGNSDAARSVLDEHQLQTEQRSVWRGCGHCTTRSTPMTSPLSRRL